METNIYQIAEKISKLYQEAYDVYLPLVENVCGREVFDTARINICTGVVYICK